MEIERQRVCEIEMCKRKVVAYTVLITRITQSVVVETEAKCLQTK